MSFLPGIESIPPSFLPHDLVPSKRSILYLPGPQESWRPFLPFYTNLQNSLPWIHSFHSSSSRRGRKSLRVTVQKGGNAWNLLFPSAMLSISAALNAYVLSTSISFAVKCPVPEAGEVPNKPKICFWDAWMRLKLPVVRSGAALFQLLTTFCIHQCPDL